MLPGVLGSDVIEPLTLPATFLVADIVESSRPGGGNAIERSVAPARLDALMRRSIADHQGRVFTGAGDGVWAVFERAEPALLAAMAIQATFRELSRGDPGAVGVRIALTSGVAERRVDDYVGPLLSGLAQLVQQTPGGQILASAATLRLARVSMPSSVRARQVGELALQGSAAPMRIFEVVADADAHPARTPLAAAQHGTANPAGQSVDHGQPARVANRERRLAETRSSQTGDGAAGLRVTMLGGWRVERGGQEIDLGRSDARGWPQLFRCLLCRPSRRITKDEAYDLFWPESALDAVHTTFRVSLSRFRLLLEPGVPHGSSIIVHNRDSVFLRPEADIWVDADEFERLVTAAGRTAEPDELLEEADRLYTDDLLPDDRYADWAIPRRDRLRTLWTDLQFDLARRREARRDVNGAISALQRLLTADRRDERAARELMLLLARHGRRSEAVVVYEHLMDALRGGHGDEPAEPEDATEVVHREIMAGSVPMVNPSIPSVFAGLVQAQRDTIPADTSALIDRESEIERARARLLSPDVRLLSLVGAGGSGKTRLARAVARAVGEEFAGHVYYVDLAPITDHRLAVPRIAQVLGVRADGERPLAESVHSAIGKHRVLLVLDNLEQILEASLDVSALLAACPNMTVLVTSRSPLHIRGERIFDVSPLPVPELVPGALERPHLSDLAESPAVRLFVERAQDVRADFELTDENAGAVVEICRRLDGLPLAIELAAARVRMYAVPRLLAQLPHRLAVLTGGPRDMPHRHQTMRNAILWSYDLLTPEVQSLFGTLAICAGGFAMEAVAELAAPSDARLDPEEAIQALLDASLLRAEKQPDGEVRFRMLETIRDLGIERLREDGALETLQERYARYYLRLAEEAEGTGQPSWQRHLAREHDNFRAVLGWALERDELEIGLRLAGSIWPSWGHHGHASDGRAWLEAALDREAALPPERRVPDAVRAKASIGAAELLCTIGDIQQALARSSESLELYERLGDRAGQARSLHCLGWARAYAAETDAEYRQARVYQEECLALQRELRDEVGAAKALHELGEIARYLGDYASATRYLEEALATRRRLGDEVGLGWSLHCLAWTEYDQRADSRVPRLERALQVAEDALARWRALDTPYPIGIATTSSLIARIAWRQGDRARAMNALAESLPLWWRLQHPMALGYDVEVLAGLEAESRASVAGIRRAATLLAMAEVARGHRPPPLHRRGELAALVTQFTARLGQDALRVAWNEGLSVSIDGVAQYAASLVAVGQSRRAPVEHAEIVTARRDA